MSRFLRAAAPAFLLLLGSPADRSVLAAPGQTEAARHEPPNPTIVEIHLTGMVEPVMAEYIGDGLTAADSMGAALVLITIDTPGGLDASMRDIVRRILDSRAPVAVYVTPGGARAASAGFFILLAADVAAMAPGTHTGAASPVAAIGGYPVTLDPTMTQKIVNDATAYLRSFASRRGRNVELAETAITEAKAFTEQEALDSRLCDLIAASREDLLAALDGRPIARFDGRTAQLALARPNVVPFEMTGRQRFLARIVQPDVFFVLLLVGVLGLYTEFTHPGLIVPGVIGAIAAVLALFAMQILPITATGLLLLALAFALFLLEAKYTSHGVLGTGGAVAMLMGALMLVRSPITPGGVTPGVALGATLPFAVLTIVLMRLVLRSRRWAPQTGVERLVDETGEARAPIGPGAPDEGRGLVFVHGELWRAVSSAPIPAGARVRVLNVDGLTLQVEPVETSAEQ